MLAMAIHQSAGVGVGTFLGVLIMMFIMRRSGKKVRLLNDSVVYTALVVGMGAWTLAAVLRLVVGMT
jgi:hypothetical protein